MDQLAELALDLHWAWSHSTDQIWQQLDPELWELTHNPWVVLQTTSNEKLGSLLANTEFRRMIDEFVRAKRESAGRAAWFQQTHSNGPLTAVAYFSMEFMLSEALPIYSGGLGNVAGDQLKSASDLGVPVIGVGLLYQRGYFRQVIDSDGNQLEFYPFSDPWQLPISPVRKPDGEWLRLRVSLPGYSLWLRAWQVEVGRVKLYLLDSNDPGNTPTHRSITSELYGGGPELRLQQEMALGLGGWRLLRAVGANPEICHLNEGHAALAVLERARNFMEDTGQPFDVALTATRAGNLFTTHTPVPAGIDRFDPALIQRYLARYAESRLGILFSDLLALGRENPEDPSEPFNMAYLAFRGSGAVNAVSRRHAEVSRRIFQPLFPRWPAADVPIGSVTNGVHVPTWDSVSADRLWTCVCGKERWLGATDCLEAPIRRVSDSDLWQLRADNRQSLIEHLRQRLARQLAAAGAPDREVEDARHIFDSNALTIGFCRRFAEYKRPTLLLNDPSRLTAIIGDPTRPVQLIVAGKAHPEDEIGQAMIREWIQFLRRPEVRAHAVFLSDYDMSLTERLVQGVDVWINTPRKSWEACGTSGMKVLVNGGLNVSVLDGWWAEAFAPDLGWAIEPVSPSQDTDQPYAQALYSLLETEIIPQFYTRDATGIPRSWVARMRESMARLTPQYSANRTVREYTERYYLPAAEAYRWRSKSEASVIRAWTRDVARAWPGIHFGDGQVETTGGRHEFSIPVYLGELSPESVSVEVYADSLDGKPPLRAAMSRGQKLMGAVNGYVYTAGVSADRPVGDYTLRVVPAHAHAAVPLEANQILWQR